MDRIMQIVEQLPHWRNERLPPPRVSQSQYDKVGLTSTSYNSTSGARNISDHHAVLQWIWEFSHGPQANLILPYAVALMYVPNLWRCECADIQYFKA